MRKPVSVIHDAYHPGKCSYPQALLNQGVNMGVFCQVVIALNYQVIFPTAAIHGCAIFTFGK